MVGARDLQRSPGWFDGNATKLFPMPEAERAQRTVALAGGVPQTLSRGREAHAAG